jgi:DNA polymerase, archaea type
VTDDATDLRDYDVERYAKLLRDTYVSRLARAAAPEDYATVFADPGQMSLFAQPVSAIRTVLVSE